MGVLVWKSPFVSALVSEFSFLYGGVFQGPNLLKTKLRFAYLFPSPSPATPLGSKEDFALSKFMLELGSLCNSVERGRIFKEY